MITFDLKFTDGLMHASFHDAAKRLWALEEVVSPVTKEPHLLIGRLYETRMLLRREHAQALIEVLQRFVDKAGT